MRIGRIHPGLRAKIVDGAIQHEQLLAVARLQRCRWISELRLGVRSQLVDRLLVSGLGSFYLGKRRTLQKRLVAVATRPTAGAMQINPASRNRQDQHHGRDRCGLPSQRETEPKREPAPSFRAVLLDGSFCRECSLDAGPQRRRIRVVAQLLRRDADSLPSAEFLGADGAARAVRFESSPFGGRAILKNSVAIFTFDVHRRYRAPAALLPRGGSSTWRRFRFA